MDAGFTAQEQTVANASRERQITRFCCYSGVRAFSHLHRFAAERMTPAPALHLRTYAAIALMVVLSSFGDMFLSLGMKRIGAVHSWDFAVLGSFAARVLTSGTIWLGIGLLLLFFVCYLAALSWADFSFLKPSMAIGYAFVAFLGYQFLGENVSPTRWTGVACICSGVAIVGLTKIRTTGPHT